MIIVISEQIWENESALLPTVLENKPLLKWYEKNKALIPLWATVNKYTEENFVNAFNDEAISQNCILIYYKKE